MKILNFQNELLQYLHALSALIRFCKIKHNVEIQKSFTEAMLSISMLFLLVIAWDSYTFYKVENVVLYLCGIAFHDLPYQ